MKWIVHGGGRRLHESRCVKRELSTSARLGKVNSDSRCLVVDHLAATSGRCDWADEGCGGARSRREIRCSRV
jgi:hypothetical protein